jgi:hypothetical protein
MYLAAILDITEITNIMVKKNITNITELTVITDRADIMYITKMRSKNISDNRVIKDIIDIKVIKALGITKIASVT